MNYLKMLLSNEKRIKIQGIIKRIAQDKSITLEERIYLEKFAPHIALGEMVNKMMAVLIISYNHLGLMG